MKENKKGKGWHEKPDHTGKAPEHRAVACKGKLKDTLREPMAAEPEPEEKEIFYRPSRATFPDLEPVEMRESEIDLPGEVPLSLNYAPPEDVPLLPEISVEQAEAEEIVEFNFAVPTSRIAYLEKFAYWNGLEVKITGSNIAHAELSESYVEPFLKAISDFEEEFEKEMEAKRGIGTSEEKIGR